MTAQQIITEHLDIWTAARKTRSTAGRGSNNKLELVGIKKLRELILELAVRGKLVPQDAIDEPASELLKKIAAKKAKLIKEGKIKKEKPFPEFTDEEKPFELPDGWELARLGEIINVLNGRAYKKHEMLSEGTPLLRVGNLFTSNEWYYSNLELEPDKYIDDGDLIYAWSASFGPFIWEGGKVIYHYHIWKMDLFSHENVDKYYLKNYLQAISAAIKASGNGIAMIHMTKERMEKLALPIPPLAEQHRIVAKVDELMAFCDQLEQTQSENIAAHAQLVEALLVTLTNSSDHNELQNNWQRIAARFDTLFTTERSIDQLKQTILQLAVMGKLVTQNPNDEPASELLKKIAAEKNRLEIEERLRTTAEESIDQSEHYIQLPRGWEFARLGNLAKFIDYRGKTPTKVESGIPLITAKNVRFGYIDRYPAEYITESDYEVWMTRGYPRLNDVLFTTEAPLGNVALVDIEEKFALAQRVICFQLHQPDIAGFIRIAIMSTQFQEQLIEIATGMTATGVKSSKLKEIPIVIPPLSEQHRIVTKVDELMTLCDTLKTNLQNAQTTQLALADALVEQALN